MSKILYQNNNLVVTGEIGEEYSCIPIGIGEVGKEEDMCRYIFLQFIVQVNGKMVIHNQDLMMCKNNGSYEISEWYRWYTLCGIFSSLGYTFTDDRIDMSVMSNNIIKSWIDKLS